jgi:hypothetical protein
MAEAEIEAQFAITDNALKVEEQQSFETEDASEPIPPADIVAYNELRSCADLFRLHSTEKLEIQPDFQREVVWKKDEQSRFIDSLVKQLPIPSMCFSLDYKTQKWKVIDGLQRMSTIIQFLTDKSTWKLSNLTDIHPDLRGQTNIQLRNGEDSQKRLYALVEDVSIPITVIRCDYTQESHMRYLFTIFHRLNSGGVRLNNQEIRNCIYTGPFNDLLKAFDAQSQSWASVKRRIWGSMSRFRSTEVLLRMLALGDKLPGYDGNLARFLNDYMHSRSKESGEVLIALQKTMESVTLAASEALKAAPEGKLPLTQVEGLLVGLYENRASIKNKTPTQLQSALQSMLAADEFSSGARYAVSNVENVQKRLKRAASAFA